MKGTIERNVVENRTCIDRLILRLEQAARPYGCQKWTSVPIAHSRKTTVSDGLMESRESTMGGLTCIY